MVKKLFRMILPLMVVSLMVVGNAGCTYFSPLVGKWQDSESSNIIEFTRDGNVVLNSNGELTSGTYQLVSSDVVKLNFEGLSGEMASAFGVDTWQYTISGNTMTVVAGGSTDVFYKVGSSATTQMANAVQTITMIYPKGGETFHVGQTITIKWESSNIPANESLDITLSTPSGSYFQINNSPLRNTSSYKWIITNSYIVSSDVISVANPNALCGCQSNDFTVTK